MAKRKPENQVLEDENLEQDPKDTEFKVDIHIPDKASSSVPLRTKPLINETEWFNYNGHVIRFVKIPPFIFNEAKSQSRRLLRENKPEPPLVTQGSRQIINKNDPYYKERLDRWNGEWNDVEDMSNQNVLLLFGVEMKEAIPPLEDWLHPLFDRFFIQMGYDNVDDMLDSMGNTRQQMIKLYFYKYVLFDNELLIKLTAYQEGELAGEQITEQYAVDMFRPETE